MALFLDFIFFFTLVSIYTKPKFILANSNSIRGNESDYEALMAIKRELKDDPNLVLSSWNSTLPICQWRGVTCGRRHTRVVGLDLSSSNLFGTLSPFVGNLSFLRLLKLSYNYFGGHIPHQISHLSRLRRLYMANNLFEGEIPANLSRCLRLSILNLHGNKLKGKIPTEVATLPSMVHFNLSSNILSGRLQDIGVGNMSTSLKSVVLYENGLQGSIPDDIGRLTSLEILDLGYNILNGIIPISLFNLSNLKVLSITNTSIHGHLPQDLGLRLPQLYFLSLYNNSLTGKVPTSLSNMSKIEIFQLGFNHFTGRFSLNGNNLPRLSVLHIRFAFSMGREARDMGFLDTLTNCTHLKVLEIGGNSFTGTFPHSILNFSTTLKVLDLSSNRILGSIPFGLGKFINIIYFGLHHNHFTGPIPNDIGMLRNVIELGISYNNISGGIPSSLGNMTYLSILGLEYNSLEGSLPKTLGSFHNLQWLNLAYNNFSGVFPTEIFSLSSLLCLWVSQNNLEGSILSEISMLKNLIYLEVSDNRFSGEIPSTLAACTSLTELGMARNSFVGSIPDSLTSLESIQYLDLSCNHLSGQIPSYFSTWPHLLNLNLSFNDLEGEVPLGGFFANTTIVSIVGNKKLCGGVLELHLPSCPLPKQSNKRFSMKMVVLISTICVLVMVLSIGLCLYLCYSSRKRKNTILELRNITPFLEVSYHTLLRATNGFSPSNLVGVGGFGYVYKGILCQGNTEMTLAIKVINIQNEGASKSFNAECKALRNIRHRNLVKIITACSSIDSQGKDFKALVYEFMPRGSLDSYLHSNLATGDPCILSLFQRLSIAIDVACALEYLHTQCENPITHCDLKPTNILLDDDMTARVGDFGLSKFLCGASTSDFENHSTTQVRGTVGYVAPEYGLGSNVSTEGDMYSFGIIVLEIMTAKKPTDPMFSEGLSLHDFAKSSLPNGVMEIIDERMFGEINVQPFKTRVDIKKIECVELLIMVGVQCSLELPRERMSVKDAINELKSAWQNLATIRF